MGHNISDRKMRELRAEAHATSGWRPFRDGSWERIDTPAGVVARRGLVLGTCRSAGCWRKVTLDASAWVRMGLGDARLAEVKLAYRCGAPLCGLVFTDERFPGGLPLMGWANEKAMRVAVECRRCGFGRFRSVGAFVRAAVAAGTGAWGMTREELGPHCIRGACPCGARDWWVWLETAPTSAAAPPDAPAAG